VTTYARIPIAVFLSSFDPGGTEKQMTELIRRLDRRRFAVHAVCFHRRGPWLAGVEEAAESIVEFPIQGFRRPATWRQMAAFAAWCRAREIAVLQACDFYANVFALPAAARAGVPLRVGSRRDLNPDKSRPKLALQRLAYAAAHRVVANSQAAASWLLAERVPPRSIAVIPNGIDFDGFPAAAPRVGPLRRVITVANLRSEKAHEILIEAAARLRADWPDLEYLIVGDGPRREELEALSRARGLERQVRFLGQREDVPALLAASDVFVLPSRTEAFPNGIMEAMAAGLPAVACAVGGILELVAPGRTGSLVAPDDPAALAAALGALLADPARARVLGAAAQRHIEARYSFDRMVAAFEGLYLEGLQERGAGLARAAA
jgi:L-malate glycosyltransferase